MPTEHKLSFDKMRNIVFFSLIVLLSIGMLYLVRPFFYPIFWAAVIAVMFYPAYMWLQRHTHMPNLSASLTMTLVVSVLIIPLLLISALVVRESFQLYFSVSNSSIFTNVDSVTAHLDSTVFGPYVERVQQEWTGYAQDAAKNVSGFLFTSIRSITENTLRFVFMLFVMFYSLFYFLKDGKRILKRLMYLVPLGDKYEKMLYERFTSTTRATLKSTVIVGGMQGILGGILFWIAGVEGALVWAVIMTALAIIPAVGSFLVWIPAGIILLAMGQTTGGLVILIGGFIISQIDNPIRAKLIGDDIQMHPMVVFLATLGGLILFGVSGFIIGPVIAALYLAIMAMYDHYYKNELRNN